MSKKMGARPLGRDDAQQVFRQLAWNLAGTLAKPTGKSGKASKPGRVRRTASK